KPRQSARLALAFRCLCPHQEIQNEDGAGHGHLVRSGGRDQAGHGLAKMVRWYTHFELLKLATSDNAELLALSGSRSPYAGEKFRRHREGRQDLQERRVASSPIGSLPRSRKIISQKQDVMRPFRPPVRPNIVDLMRRHVGHSTKMLG